MTDMLEELQALDEGQPERPPVETRPVRFSKGDVVALKHNWKRYLEPFFLAILREVLEQTLFIPYNTVTLFYKKLLLTMLRLKFTQILRTC